MEPSPPPPPSAEPPSVVLSPPRPSAVHPTGNASSSNSPTPSTNSTSPTLPPPPASPNGGLLLWNTALIVGIGIGGLIVLVGLSILVIFYRRKRRKLQLGGYPPLGPKGPTPTEPISTTNMGSISPFSVPSPGMTLGLSHSTLTYEELEIATNGFSNLNLLGEGGFGYVHKGVLSSGKVVAIKQLKAGSRQGEREFQAEVEIISHIHHRHLVSLVDYCISGAKRILVHEFVPNSMLQFHLHGKDNTTMAWPTRMKIALGSARGLAYLHEECKYALLNLILMISFAVNLYWIHLSSNPKIIHRDIKAANILLESNFEAKVADFGLAKFASDIDTHVSTRVMGTFGYLAPEYASGGNLTEKSDVFSFGVVLLELITGRHPLDRTQPFDEDSMVDWVVRALEGNLVGAI